MENKMIFDSIIPLFIVLEGIDGSGTSTQLQMLRKEFEKLNIPVHTTREPSDSKIGKLIREMIKGDSNVKPSWQTMTLLFSADRFHHLSSEIIPQLLSRKHVLCDRYYHSTVAYQSIMSGFGEANINWIKEMNKESTEPDMIFVIDVDSDLAMNRVDNRNKVKDIYETNSLQKGLEKFYSNIEKHFPNENIIHVDGNQGIECVTSVIMQHIINHMKEL